MGDIYDEIPGGDRNEESSKKTAMLDTYGECLNDLSKKGKLDPVIGRESEIFRLIQILGRRRKNNPILIGEPGVGKTAIVEGLADRIVNGDVPLALKDKIIYTIELSSIVAGTKYRGQFEERMKAIIGELIENPNIIIFIDEIHTIMGAGSSAGSLDASNIIKPALARGHVHCIGATTFDEFRENIETDGALDRRFQKVLVNQPTLEETKKIIINIQDKYEAYHNVRYSETIIDLIIKLTDRYMIDRFFPDKAIDVLDEVGSYKQLVSSSTPIHIKKLEEKYREKERLKSIAVKGQEYERAANERDKAVSIKRKIKHELDLWKNKLGKRFLNIEEDDVFLVISKTIGVPIEKLSDEGNRNLLGLERWIKSRIIGQDHAVEKLSTTIKRNRVGIRRSDSTIGNFIFLGPTGVGKTQLAKEINNYLFDSEDSLIRIDMSEYMEKHSVSKLIGAPPGYVGYNEGGFLTEHVKRKPHSVVLFDEIEKAHPDTFNILLQVLDDGFLTDSIGRKIDFRNTLIIMTSNTGLKKLEEFGTGIGFKQNIQNDAIEQEVLQKSLKQKFPPEFLNRIDEIIIFNKLTKENLLCIIENEITDISKNLKEIGEYRLKISKGAKDILVNTSFDGLFGARPLKRILTKLVENPISELILNGKIKQNDLINVKTVNGAIRIEIK
mgnify:CR=1 FL=1|tara:strand:+ start:22680 stop:24683 length:2004 start_codon:yes stop_codon:yes gene_type:complete